MIYNSYELEINNRKIAEHQDQAQNDKIVKRLKRSRRPYQKLTAWQRLLALIGVRSGKRITRKSIEIAYNTPASLGVTEDK